MRRVALLALAIGLAACEAIVGLNHDYTLDLDASKEGSVPDASSDASPDSSGTCSFATNPQTSLAANVGRTDGIAVDDKAVYVTDRVNNRAFACATTGQCELWSSAPWDGGINPPADLLEGPGAIALDDGDRVFFGGDAPNWRVTSAARDGGGWANITASGNGTVNSIVYSTGLQGVFYVAADPGQNERINFAAANNVHVLVAGGDGTQPDATSIVIAQGRVFWTVDGSVSEIHSCMESTTANCTWRVDRPTQGPAVLTASSTALYWSDSAGVHRCGAPDCTNAKLLSGDTSATSAHAIAVDSCGLYWTKDGLNGGIYRCALADDCATGPKPVRQNISARALALGTDKIWFSVDQGDAGMVEYVPK